MSKLYDINVWNRGSYLTEALPAIEQYDEWMLCPYEINKEEDGYGTGAERPELSLVLTPEEAEQLTLGWGTDLGGDYTPDEDFWIDSESFLATYKVIPDRVSIWLDELPGY